MPKIAVIGTTSWGITLGVVVAKSGRRASLWARTEEEAAALRAARPNRATPAPLPPGLAITSSMSEALSGAEAVILAVPSQTMRRNINLASPCLTGSMLLVSAAKGLELGSNQRMSQVIADETPPECHANICVLSGPNLSREVVRGLPAATVIAAASEAVAQRAQRLITSESFCVYTNTDMVGVELGGAFKNIIALGAGIIDGLDLGDNTKAAFITRGMIEISALGLALGANPLTFSGLAGVGDVIATCSSHLSRNHYVGMELARGRRLEEITASMTSVAEGINTTAAARELAHQHGLGMPVIEKVYDVLFSGAKPCEVVDEITADGASHELAGKNWNFMSFSNHKPG